MGRGKVVTFEASPAELRITSHLEPWALRAATEGRYAHLRGPFTANSPLALFAPSPEGGDGESLLPLSSQRTWRQELTALIARINSPEGCYDGPLLPFAPVPFVPLMTAFPPYRDPAASFEGGVKVNFWHGRLGRLTPAPVTSLSTWAEEAPAPSSAPDLELSPEAALVPPSPSALPALENLAGSVVLSEGALPLVTLAYPQSGAPSIPLTMPKPSMQRLIWAGPDAGAGETGLSSAEEHGWLSPVPAREITLRSAHAVCSTWEALVSGAVRRALPAASSAPALLMPFDAHARRL